MYTTMFPTYNTTENISNDNGTTDTENRPGFVCGVAGVPYFIGGSVISICGILLNMSFIFVFCRVRYMRSLTNRYLINLAICDMLLLLSVLMYYILRLTYGQLTSMTFNCALNFLHTVLLFVSLWMITIISIERYLGICNPLKARLLNTHGRTSSLVACTWLLGSFCAVPKLVSCILSNTDMVRAVKADNANIIMYCIMFFSSIVIVPSMYALTVSNFRSSIRKLGKDRRTTRKSDETQVLVTCICISVIFFVCTIPAAYKYIMHIITQFTNVLYGGKFTICMYSLNRWLLLINSSVNPFIYTLTSARCRKAFAKAFLCYRKDSKGGYPNMLTYANSSTTHIGTDV